MSDRGLWVSARQAILDDATKVFSQEPRWTTEGRRINLRVNVSHSTVFAVDLQVVGHGSVFGEKLSISLLSGPVQLIRLCQGYGDHEIPGWHGLWLPQDGKQPRHNPDHDLAGLSRRDAMSIFCLRAKIEMPEQMQLRWPEEVNDGL